MSLLHELLRPSRGTVALAILAGLAGGASGVALIALAQAELAGSGSPSPALAWAFAGLCLVASAARVVAQVAMIRLGQGAVTSLALRLCRKVLGLPLEEFESLDPGALTAILTEDIVIVANALAGIPLIAINLPIVAACLAYAGWLSPAALACGLAVAVPAVLGSMALSARALRHLRAARGEQDAMVGHFRTLIDGFRELKLHHGRRDAFLADDLAPAATAVRDRTVTGLSLYAVSAGWGQFASFGFIGLLLFVLPGLAGLDRSTLAGAVLIVLFLMPSLDVLLAWIPALGRARASLQRIEALLPSLESRHSEAETAGGRRAPAVLGESIELGGVTYAYRSGHDDAGFVLGPIDLILRPGELVFLIGGNGSGKTTLVKLLCGLYAPRGGSILLDGRPVTRDDLEAYRQLFTVVFADGHLFRTLPGPAPDPGGVWAERHLARLGLEDRVRIQDRAFSTLALSVGQRRRLALLAACLEDRPVCILDEWAAHQDAGSKRFFYRELLPELKARGKALLVISHDEHDFEAADRILRLDGGLIREVDGVAIAGGTP